MLHKTIVESKGDEGDDTKKWRRYTKTESGAGRLLHSLAHHLINSRLTSLAPHALTLPPPPPLPSHPPPSAFPPPHALFTTSLFLTRRWTALLRLISPHQDIINKLHLHPSLSSTWFSLRLCTVYRGKPFHQDIAFFGQLQGNATIYPQADHKDRL